MTQDVYMHNNNYWVIFDAIVIPCGLRPASVSTWKSSLCSQADFHSFHFHTEIASHQIHRHSVIFAASSLNGLWRDLLWIHYKYWFCNIKSGNAILLILRGQQSRHPVHFSYFKPNIHFISYQLWCAQRPWQKKFKFNYFSSHKLVGDFRGFCGKYLFCVAVERRNSVKWRNK